MKSKRKISKISGISIISIYGGVEKEYIDKIHNFAIKIVKYYIKKYGLYPHSSLKIIPGEKKSIGGYPVSRGVISLHGINEFDSKPEEYWLWLTAHEIGHMYCGFYLLSNTDETIDNLSWLMLGLGLYMDKIFLEDNGIKYKQHQQMINAYKKIEEKYGIQSFNTNKKKMRNAKFDYNTIVLHGRSIQIISNLEKEIGKSEFNKLFKKLLLEHGNEEINFRKFINFLELNQKSFKYSQKAKLN